MGYYDEYLKKKEKSPYGGSYYKQWVAKEYGAEYAKNIQDKVQSWMDDHNAFVQSYTDRFGNRGNNTAYVSDSSDWYDTASATSGRLNTAADEILLDLDRYGYIYGDEYVQAVRDMVTSGRGAYSGIIDSAKSDADYWKQFNPTEEQAKSGVKAETIYYKWLDEQKYRDKYAGMSYDEVQRESVAVSSEEEAEWLRSYLPTLWGENEAKAVSDRADRKVTAAENLLGEYNRLKKVGGAEYEAISRQIGSQYGGVGELENEIGRLKSDATTKAGEARFGFLQSNEDFDRYSVYDPAVTTGDYAYLNMSQAERAAYRRELIYADIEEGNETGDSAAAKHFEKLDQLTADEIAVYNYIYKKKGEQEAAAYLEWMTDTMQGRIDERVANFAADYAKEHPWAASGFSIATSLGSGFEHLKDAAGYLVDKALGNPNAKIDVNTNAMITNAIRGKVSEQTNWTIGKWDAFDFLYNTGMSGLDSLAASTLFGNFGGSILGLSAAAQGTQDALDRGMSNDQAFWNGLFAGVFESVFESVSIGNFKAMKDVKPESVKDVFKNIAKSMLVNASEEALTEIANIGYDTLVNGEFANYTVEDLKNGAWKDALGQVIEAGGSGALMGFGFGGIGSAVGYHNGNRQVKSDYGDSQTELVAEALEIDPNNAYAKKMQGRLDSGKNLTGSQLNRLVQQNEAAIAKMGDGIEDAGAWDGVTNAVSKPLGSYPAAKQSTIQSFIGAVDQKIKGFVESVKNGDKTFRREKISDVSDRAAADISDLLGIDVSGYTNNINTNGMQHIINRHGENGVHDNTMANDNDIARVGWVLENYDSVELVKDNGEQTYSAEFRDSNNNPAPQVRFIKKIDGTYYVVEAACENKYKKLWVQSAYLQKNEDVTQVPTAEQNVSHERHAQSELASPSSLTSIPDSVTGVNGENVDPLAQLAREAVEVRYAEEEGDSAEGRAIYQDQAVDVVDIDKAGGGKVSVKLADGRSVDATALEYEDSGEAELWRVIGQYAEDADSARALLEEYRNGDLDAYKYARGIEEAFLFGKLNLSPKEMEIKGSMVNDLSAAQRNVAYTLGKRAGEKKAQQQKKDASQHDPKHRRKGAVHYGYDGQQLDKSKLKPAQRVGVEFAERLAQKKGMTFYFYRSFVQDGVRVYKNAKGETVPTQKNGWYDPSDGSIHIDLNSGDMGSTVMFTIAHELTHWMKDTNLTRYRELCGIVTEGFLERGQSVDRLVKNKMEEYREGGEKLTWEEAYDEVIASSLEGVLSDGRVIDLLDAAETKSMELWEQLKSFFEDIAALIRDTVQAYRNVEPESPEGRMVMRMKDLQTQIQDVFAAGIHEGGEDFREGGKINTAPEGGVKCSYIGNTKDGRRCYQSGFDDSVSMDERIELFKKRIATIFNLGAVELKTDVKKIKILGDKFTSQKNLFGDLKPKGSEYTAKINSLYDIADILATSKYDPNATSKEPSYANPGVKPKNAAHKNVKYWYKFRNEIVFDGIPYTVTFNIRDKGTAQYQYLIEFKENKTPGISNTAVKKPPANAPSVLQGQYTQSGSKSQQNSIRYQKNEAAQTHMAEQNDAMAEDVKSLNDLVAAQKQGKAERIRKSTTETAAAYLMKIAGAKGEKSDLADLLSDFYTYVATSTEQSWESIREKALPVVRWLMDNNVRTKQRSDYAQDILNTLHNSRVRLDETQKGEVAHIYGSFSAFRNTVMGSIILVNDGISLDSQWQEWAEMYPDVFDKDMNATDMPEALSDIIRRMRNDNTSELEYEYNREFIEQELLSRVYDSYWNASTLYSVADHYESKIKQLKAKHRERMQAVYARQQTAEAEQREVFKRRQEKAAAHFEERYQRREAEYRESRRKAVERHDKAQVRQQIRKDVQRLDSLLNKGTKEKNVKLELQEFAGAALRTAKGTFLKNYNEYDMVRNGVNATMSREQKAVFARAQELLKELDKIWEERNSEPGPNSIHEKWDPEENLRRDDHEEALKKELAKNMAVLREAGIFRVENELMEDSIADQLMDELMAAYSALKDSESAHVREVFSSKIYDHMDGVKKFLAGKAVKDMTTIELAKLKDMYRMVLHAITTSNDLFAQKRKADVRALGEEVISQLRTPGKEMTAEILDTLKKMGWANLKPETALELIGSDTLTEMMQGLYRGEDTYARDLEQARLYAEEQGKKCGRNKWDMKKTVSFAGTEITLGQAMSLYAYTKRKQAQGHLEGDGFTHSSNVRIEGVLGKLPVKLSYIMNATRTHIVPKGAYADVAALLTPEQRKYVDAMQEYLSKVMGGKGNEVSMQMYGVKLFEETMYFPLKTASEYREEALGATAGEVKLRNTGFTQKTVDGASNPIVLDDFESVWAGHVDKMSLYHGFVLPMEDFDRVYNYRHAVEEDVKDAEGEVYKTKLVDTNESVKVDIENKMGKAANEYIENFMKQLNGGVRGDSTEKLFASMVRNFKKTAVLGSLSVSVQQPTAFIRAMAYLDPRDVGNPKDFLGKAGKPEAGILKEMYMYAPVALMKHIGGFDPGLGRTTRDYVFEDKKGVTGTLDKFLGAFPEKMDEWTWSYIWVCTKRQIHRQHPDLRVNSKEFLEKVGERFSKIIRDTQVYDSVLTKSQIMRSKNVFLQMATAFMNEPTTSMDMYIRSTLQAKRGKIKKSQAARTYAAVVSSQILTAAVVAFVYALRDDDEDETYWEKYLSAAIGKAWENTMPWYSIPFVKDVFSIFDGYSVERSDMSLITDLYQGWQKLQSGSATAWEKTEAFAGSILNMFGIPLKNVSRDVRSIFNTVKTWFNGGMEKTGAGLRYAMLEGLTGKDTTKAVQLQNAVAENDAKHILRVMASYSTEESAITAFRDAVKAAFVQGDVSEEQATEFLQAYAGDDAADVQKKITVWKFQGKHPESELKDGKILDYVEFAEPAGISVEIYTRYAKETADLKSDKDEEGKTVSGSKREKVLQVIHSLPLTSTQKDALYYAEGYAESNLDEAPWR